MGATNRPGSLHFNVSPIAEDYYESNLSQTYGLHLNRISWACMLITNVGDGKNVGRNFWEDAVVNLLVESEL